jgi:DNA polymerase III alpha subunit (gram-positive type)
MSVTSGTQSKEETNMAEETATTTTSTQATDSTATENTVSTGNEQANDAEQQPTAASIEKMIQSALDRERNKHGNEMKKLRAELETERKKNLSEKEIKELEMKQEREQFELERAEFKREKNKLFAIKALSEIGLNDGSDASLALVDFVMADDEAGISERVKTFNGLVEKIVKAKVDGVFKANGRTPGVGSETAANAGGQNNSIAVQLGRNTAKNNEAAQSVLNHYLGGKK